MGNETEKKIIPYFNIYASDFKVFKDMISPKEIVEVFNEISNICLFGKSNFKSENNIQMMFFQKLKDNLLKTIPKYNASVGNGQKGGRPKKTQEKPTGFEQVNPQETHSETIEYNRIEYNRIEDNIKERNIDVFCDERVNKIFSIYSDKCNKLCKLTFEKRNKQILDKVGEFLNEVDFNFEYFEELCTKANDLEVIANNKIDFKSLLNNHIGIMNGKYKQELDLTKIDFS